MWPSLLRCLELRPEKEAPVGLSSHPYRYTLRLQVAELSTLGSQKLGLTLRDPCSSPFLCLPCAATSFHQAGLQLPLLTSSVLVCSVLTRLLFCSWDMSLGTSLWSSDLHTPLNPQYLHCFIFLRSRHQRASELPHSGLTSQNPALS